MASFLLNLQTVVYFSMSLISQDQRLSSWSMTCNQLRICQLCQYEHSSLVNLVNRKKIAAQLCTLYSELDSGHIDVGPACIEDDHYDAILKGRLSIFQSRSAVEQMGIGPKSNILCDFGLLIEHQFSTVDYRKVLVRCQLQFFGNVKHIGFISSISHSHCETASVLAQVCCVQ